MCGYGENGELAVSSQALLERIRELEGEVERMNAAAAKGRSLVAASMHGIPSNTPSAFPSNLYFLDPESFGQIPASQLDPGMQVPEQIRFVLGSRGKSKRWR